MLAENIIDASTIDNLVGILGFEENMDFEEFNQLVRLLDDSTGMGLVEVLYPLLF